MRTSLSYIFYGVSLAGVSCRRRWPAPTTLALTTLWASRQAVGDSSVEIFLLLPMFRSTKGPLSVCVCLCRSNVTHNPHKLNTGTDSNEEY